LIADLAHIANRIGLPHQLANLSGEHSRAAGTRHTFKI